MQRSITSIFRPPNRGGTWAGVCIVADKQSISALLGPLIYNYFLQLQLLSRIAKVNYSQHVNSHDKINIPDIPVYFVMLTVII